jgi:type 1 glutamine amidotransferase
LNLPGGWLPPSLVNVTNSIEYVAEWIEEQAEAQQEGMEEMVKKVLEEKLALNVTAIEEEDMEMLMQAVASGVGIAGNLTEIRNSESGLNWGTGGHSSGTFSPFPQQSYT